MFYLRYLDFFLYLRYVLSLNVHFHFTLFRRLVSKLRRRAFSRVCLGGGITGHHCGVPQRGSGWFLCLRIYGLLSMFV